MVSPTFSLMPADMDEDLDLSPDTEDKDEENLEEEVEEEEPGEEPSLSELDLLKSKNQELQEQLAQIEDLKRTVGRVQSAMSKLDRTVDTDTITSLQDSMREEFGNINDLLAAIVENADETVYSADFRQKLRDLQSEAKRRADQDSLRKDMSKQTADAVKQALEAYGIRSDSAPTSTADVSEAQRLEADIVAEIRDYGLDDNDFDWDSAKRIYARQGAAATRKWFREQIAEKRNENEADTRRQARKDSGRTKSPDPAGLGSSDEDRLLENKLSFADAHEMAKKMGWI